MSSDDDSTLSTNLRHHSVTRSFSQRRLWSLETFIVSAPENSAFTDTTGFAASIAHHLRSEIHGHIAHTLMASRSVALLGWIVALIRSTRGPGTSNHRHDPQDVKSKLRHVWLSFQYNRWLCPIGRFLMCLQTLRYQEVLALAENGSLRVDYWKKKVCGVWYHQYDRKRQRQT